MISYKPVALVTGASRGIGKGIALALAHEGFHVVVNYARNADAALATSAEIEALKVQALPVQADIAVAADRQRLIAETVRTFGAVDILVNNAGIAPQTRADILDATEDSFDQLIEVNLKGPYFLTQLAARQMIRQVLAGHAFKPRIVTVSSISAYTASTNRGDYCIAKAGLSMTTALFAARLAEYGINVFEVRPGIIETDMTEKVKGKYDKLIFESDLTPIHRWGTPDDVARAVVAIARDLFPFSTGQVLNIDGGFHLRRL